MNMKNKNKTMKKSLINKFQRAMVSLAVAGMIFGSMPITAMAAEPTEVTTEVTTEAEAQSVETVANDNVETTETTSPSVEDLLGGVTNTDEVVEEEAFADLTIKVPANTILTKDGVTLTSFEADVMLTDGELILSQPTAAEYKERIESDVTVTIENSEVAVEFLGQPVEGCITDELGNSVIYMDNTLEIINADKMADMVPEEDEEDTPEEPDEVPADYTVRYFINSVADENLLGTLSVPGTEGAIIDMASVDVNMHKPVDGEGFVWADGAIQDGAATVVTADDTDVIDIVYVSETVVTEGNASFTVQYYKDDLVEGNFLGQYEVAATDGTNIDYSVIDVNKFQPENYGDGDIQTVVSAKVVTFDDSDVVYVLYTAVEEKIETITETIVEEKIVEVEVEKVVEVPVEKVVYVPTTETVTETVYVEVPVEKEVIVEVPVEKIVEVPTATSSTSIEYVYVEVPGETIYVEVPSDNDDDTPNQPEENPDPTPEEDEDTPEEYEDGPQTGDETPVVMLLALMGISLIAMFSLRKKNVKTN